MPQHQMKIPGVGGVYTKVRDKFSTPKRRQERREKEKESREILEAERNVRESQGSSSGQSARRGIVSRLAEGLAGGARSASQTRPASPEADSPPSDQGGEPPEPENDLSSENPPEENGGGNQGPTTT